MAAADLSSQLLAVAEPRSFDPAVSAMRASLNLMLSIALSLAAGASAFAVEESVENAAKTLSAATVTVRMQSPGGERAEKNDADAGLSGEANAPRATASDDEPRGDATGPSPDERRARGRRFTLASGVCVGENLIVTALRPQKENEFRVTLPGGQRAEARLCVFDAHSTLALLETKAERGAKPAVSPLAIASQPAALGTRLVAASAWGSESPTVSVGVLGGVDRFIPSSLLPPLLQCDVHTTETSRGAGVVNAAGELVGIVVAVEGDDRRSSWTYLIGAEHVDRLIAARKPGEVVELPRRVAHAGLDLRQVAGSDTLVVKNVVAGGPAEKAGIRAGDELRSLDGRAIHSAFAAARTVASRKPGDAIACAVRRGEAELNLTLTLEASADEPAISYKAKESPARDSDESGKAATQAATTENDGKQTDPRRLPELSKGRSAESKPATIPAIAPGRRTDSLDDLRARLRQQEDLVRRLEAELAELRRERDRFAGASAESHAPAAPRGQSTPAPR
ncbi:MAG: hypothetical protein DCC68_13885 [Planctomycetota bacterium]|nr:MAG: hypothetical protein DCC68_13885 [Planctomycetota bacterium]